LDGFFILFACVIITLGKGKRMPIIYCGNWKKGQSGNSVLFIVYRKPPDSPGVQ